MIKTSILPQQILVIDDNKIWLQSLEKLGVRILCCSGLSLRGIEKRLENLEQQVEVVVINANLVFGIVNQRLDNLGLRIGNGTLKANNPRLTFVFLSFHFFEMKSDKAYCFTEFLNYIISINQ